MKQSLFLLITLAFFTSCGQNQKLEQKSHTATLSREAIDAYNHPQNFANNHSLSDQLFDVPEYQIAQRPAWTGHWWPMSQGGLTARITTDLSPIEKYDRATGGNGQGYAVQWEKEHSKISARGPNGKIIKWAGHCHGVAAAALNYAEPKNPVTYKGITFTPEDIKALLTESYIKSAGSSLIGSRCNTTTANSRSGSSHCRDINPGTFHMVLGSVLGQQRKPFIIDISSGSEVWNYPVNEYWTSHTIITENEAASYLRSRRYTYNNQADSFALVKTTLRLATGDVIEYNYILELQALRNNYRILGGEWIGEGQKNHPDFAWVAYGVGAENPYLDTAIIEIMARQSVEGGGQVREPNPTRNTNPNRNNNGHDRSSWIDDLTSAG